MIINLLGLKKYKKEMNTNFDGFACLSVISWDSMVNADEKYYP